MYKNRLAVFLFFGMLLSMTFVAADESEDFNPFTLNAPGGLTGSSGLRVVALMNATILNITRASGVDGVMVSIRNDSNYSFVQSTFSGDVATLNFNVTAGQAYRIIVNNSGGGGWNHRCINNPTLPGTSGLFSWTDGILDDNPENTSYFCNIAKIGYNATALLPTYSVVANATTYETSRESFTSNVSISGSTLSTAFLHYGGTRYTGTSSTAGTNYYLLSAPLDVSNIGSKLWYWNVTLANGTILTTIPRIQYSAPINMTLCRAAPLNIPYLNFTFKDETNETYMNASTDIASINYYLGTGTANKTMSFSNSTVNPSYAFCFTPQNRTVNSIVAYQYSAPGYPQRQYSLSSGLTNSTTNTILYLLGSSSGIYSSYQVINSIGNPIPGATVQVERQFGGTWTLIGQATSDSSGLVTFWLNPNFDHRLTASKSGYPTTTVTIRPTQSLYSIVMSSGSVNGTYNEILQGIRWTKTPSPGVLSPGSYNFTFTINATNSNMVNCKFDLTNSSGYVLGTVSSTCTSIISLGQTYTISAGQDLYGKYYVDVGTGYILLEGDGNWKSLSVNNTRSYRIKELLNYLSDPDVWAGNSEEKLEYEYTKFVAFFLIFALIIAFANAKTQFDNVNPGIFLFGLPFLMILVNLSGGVNGPGFFYMQGATTFDFLDNWIIPFYSLLIAIGFYLATIRREG